MCDGTYIPEAFEGWPCKWAPDIGDGISEVGVMPKPTGLDQPPDIGDGTGEEEAMPELLGDPDLPPGGVE